MPSGSRRRSGAALAAAASKSQVSSPSQPNGIAHGVKWVGDLRPFRVEVVDDPLAVDAHGDRLADLDVVPRLERVVEAEEERVQALARVELRFESPLIVAMSSVPGLSMPSTVPACSSSQRWAASSLQRNSRFGVRALVAPVVVERVRRPSGCPCSHALSLYGPVPFGLSRTTCRPRAPRGSPSPGCRRR